MMTRDARKWGILGLLTILTFLPGCMICANPVTAPPTAEHREIVLAPQCCRNGVHVFLINGIDPLDCGNLSGLRRYLNEHGFPKTYHGEAYHCGWYRREILRIREQYPEDRIAVVAFDWGATIASKLVRELNDQHIAVDLVVLLDPKGLAGDEKFPCPKVFNLRAESGLTDTVIISGAENITVAESSHFGVPTHPLTIELLHKELNALAMGVPQILGPLEPPAPLVDPAPSPRPITAVTASKSDGWDYLKPRFAVYNPASETLKTPESSKNPALLPNPTPTK